MSAPPFYELLELLGEGGMGRVYRGLHHPSGTEVAVKMLRASVRHDAWRRRLLLNEATAAAQLRHPNIVELIDVGTDPEGAPFLVMELVEGGDLGSWRGAWPGWEAVAQTFDDTLAGLVTAHAAGIIHRDLKPANVMLAGRRGAEQTGVRAKIADFGVARVVDPLKSEEQNAEPAGTPLYMAPEQFLGDANMGPWTDLYAVGVMMFELISGKVPFEAEQVVKMAAVKLTHDPPDLVPRRGLQVPAELIDLVSGLLQREARRRPRFARDVQDRFAALCRHVVDRVPVGAGPTIAAVTDDHETEVSDAAATRLSEPPGQDTRVESVGAIEIEPEAQTLVSQPASPETGPRASHPPELPQRISAGAGSAPGRALSRLRELPMVGRSTERNEMMALANDVLAHGGARLLVLVGEAGIGKSRIARWGLAEVERRALMEGVAAGYDVSAGGMVGGLRHAIRRLAGRPTQALEGPPADGVPQEWRWLANAAGRLPFDAQRLERWLEARKDEHVLGSEESAAISHDVLRAASAVRPVFLWIDDLGWSRDGAIDLVERLLLSQDANVLMVATVRTGTTQYPPLRRRLEQIYAHPQARVRTVAPFVAQARQLLIQSIVPVSSDVAMAIASEVDGTPYFIIELIHDWIGAGMLQETPDGWRPVGDRSVAALLAQRPPEGLVLHRVDALVSSFGDDSDAAEALLLVAALLGNRFEDDAFRSCAGTEHRPLGLVDRVLDQALLHGLLRSEGSTYRFDHGLVREQLVSRLDAHPWRAELLRAAADGLLAYYGHMIPEVGVRAASLLRDAGESNRAFDTISEAVRSMARNGDTNGAAEHVERARRWLDADGVPEVDRRRALMTYTEASRRYFGLEYAAALSLLPDAVRLYEVIEDAVGLAECRMLEGSIYYYTDRFAEAEAIAREVDGLARGGDTRWARVGVIAAHTLAHLAALRGDFETTRGGFDRARHYARLAADLWRVRVATLSLADLEYVLGDLDASQRLLDQATRGSSATREPELVSEASEKLARVALARGDASRARLLIQERVQQIESVGDRWRLTAIRLLQARIALVMNRGEAALEAVRKFVVAFRDVSHDEFQTLHDMRLLELTLRQQGHSSLADEVGGMLAARRAAVHSGFAVGATLR